MKIDDDRHIGISYYFRSTIVKMIAFVTDANVDIVDLLDECVGGIHRVSVVRLVFVFLPDINDTDTDTARILSMFCRRCHGAAVSCRSGTNNNDRIPASSS